MNYTLSVRRDFIAQHALVGGDWGTENYPHSHAYVLELRLQGAELDQHGFLVDIVEVEQRLTDLIHIYRDDLLNDLPDFQELNPSLEAFSRILCTRLAKDLLRGNIAGLELVLWENETAWASCRLP